jgi:L-methionine (R)-S-oxide reductase
MRVCSISRELSKAMTDQPKAVVVPSLDKLTEQYALLCKQLTVLLQGEQNYVTNLSQFSALVFNSLEKINWAGFYLRNSESHLQLGPFQGQVACTKIPIGKGVCGTVAESSKALLVADVDQFEGHIACDSRSRSEVVCPVVVDGVLLGVFDVDSPEINRFDQSDILGLRAMVAILVSATEWY